MGIRHAPLFIALIAMGFIVAVAQAQGPAPAVAAQAPAPATTADVALQPEKSAVDANTYVIGPGDVIQVFVWRNAELTVTLPVRPDGRVSTPLVEDMVAVGKTPSQLARDIETVLGAYIRSPQVNIIVSQPVSVYSQVKIIGEITRPQGLPYREGMTVLDAVLAAGGISQFAAPNRTRVIRTVKGKEEEHRIKLGDLLNKGDLRTNILLKAGDIVVVPRSNF
jgi:polysaccharide export outer membrane protein